MITLTSSPRSFSRGRGRQAVEPARHGDVEQQHSARVLAHELQRLVAAGGLAGDLEALGFEELSQTGAPQGVIVGEDDADAHDRRWMRSDSASSQYLPWETASP